MAGDAAAAYEVAVRFAEGRGVPVNPEEAARWYERAANKGIAPAQFRYASLLEKGQGVKKDLAQARRLYLAAAAKGNGKAMHNLAVLYAEGIEGKPDYATAALWFRKAALHGIADSQYNLGVLCARGLGTAKSFEESYKWFALAAAQGDREAGKKRDEVANQLDAEALAAAQQAVKSFRARAAAGRGHRRCRAGRRLGPRRRHAGAAGQAAAGPADVTRRARGGQTVSARIGKSYSPVLLTNSARNGVNWQCEPPDRADRQPRPPTPDDVACRSISRSPTCPSTSSWCWGWGWRSASSPACSASAAAS